MGDPAVDLAFASLSLLLAEKKKKSHKESLCKYVSTDRATDQPTDQVGLFTWRWRTQRWSFNYLQFYNTIMIIRSSFGIFPRSWLPAKDNAAVPKHLSCGKKKKKKKDVHRQVECIPKTGNKKINAWFDRLCGIRLFMSPNWVFWSALWRAGIGFTGGS